MASLESGLSHLEVDDWDFWQWRTRWRDTCRILMGNSCSVKDEICFCNVPLVNNPYLQPRVTVFRQVESQQSSCLFFMFLTHLGSAHMHKLSRCTDGLSPSISHSRSSRDCTRVRQVACWAFREATTDLDVSPTILVKCTSTRSDFSFSRGHALPLVWMWLLVVAKLLGETTRRVRAGPDSWPGCPLHPEGQLNGWHDHKLLCLCSCVKSCASLLSRRGYITSDSFSLPRVDVFSWTLIWVWRYLCQMWMLHWCLFCLLVHLKVRAMQKVPRVRLDLTINNVLFDVLTRWRHTAKQWTIWKSCFIPNVHKQTHKGTFERVQALLVFLIWWRLVFCGLTLLNLRHQLWSEGK